MSTDRLFDLVAHVIGPDAAHWVRTHVEVPEGLAAFPFDDRQVHRAWLAEALNLCLFHKLVEAVPIGRTYVEEQCAAGRQVCFDHGAIRTVDWPDNGALPRGRQAFNRLLEPLGFTDVRTYPLTRLNMTGHAYRHLDLPEDIAQFFVSELHPGRFSEGFREAVSRVVGQSRDPLSPAHLAVLDQLWRERQCSLDQARELLPALHAAFDRQHPAPHEADYLRLREESVEMAWIATEGNMFNHLTDRVADLEALVAEQNAKGRPMKPSIEVSASGRVLQTAYRAVQVRRELLDASGRPVQREVPGSFVEFIQRQVDDSTGRLDLAFDSSNAQGIFKMTAGQVGA
ncbi:DUF1338 domain-containing protein [Pseudomonas otitidis]|uniref:DUF1338 domain-containing protein n=1 Tax=Metapseudomonas otitidis TaxID=319939 RepID=UPI00244C60C9|nr:DUF1338 domain-containing protein [Pseudomonas otitidis]MDH1108799.1 DUF1338 domain-containing protein [Pseudomonas otitidis]MDH1161815.1 DUF1338 domain-containing protein [Pseudomonas otitidis]MDH1164126.1 DUF1338 domain-containing protein [Pseudomonas otitidis]